jgi:hypothetical protein
MSDDLVLTPGGFKPRSLVQHICSLNSGKRCLDEWVHFSIFRWSNACQKLPYLAQGGMLAPAQSIGILPSESPNMVISRITVPGHGYSHSSSRHRWHKHKNSRTAAAYRRIHHQ